MIYDHIRNIGYYKGLSPALDTALDYLLCADRDTPNGVNSLDNGVRAIISEYSTKRINENGFEAHRQHIDVQYPVSGLENVKCCPLAFLSPNMEYDQEKDYLLFNDREGVTFTIGEGYFLVLFPEDGHMPQLCVGAPGEIKKITLKVPVR